LNTAATIQFNYPYIPETFAVGGIPIDRSIITGHNVSSI